MLEIGDNVVYEGKEYTVLWIYANGNCELVESRIAIPYCTILVHVDNLEKGTRNV
jgi:hypothetical protein